jgi:hypothetical protein
LYGDTGASSGVTILDSGNVGIGTTGPSSKLTVFGGDIAVSSAGSATTTLSDSALSGTSNLTVTTTQTLILGGGNEKLELDSNGNILASTAIYQPIYGSDDGLVLYIPFSEKIGDEVLTDNDLENWDANWTRLNELSGNGRTISTTTDSYSGTNAVQLYATTTGEFGIYQAVSTTQNAKYQLNAYFKYDPNGDGEGTVSLKACDDSACTTTFGSQTTSATTTAYSFISLRFTPTTATTYILATLDETLGNGTAKFDLLSLKKADTAYTYDYSPYGNDGAIATGAAQAPAFTAGKAGQAMQFDGVDDYVEVAGFSMPQAAFSVEMWFNQQGAGSGGAERLFTSGGSPDWATEWGILETFRFYQKWTDGTYTGWLDTGYAIDYDRWYSVSLIWDGTYFRIYVYGDLIWTSPSYAGLTPNPYSNKFGGWGDTLAGSLNALIDSVCIYNRALSAEEIKAHYLGGRLTPLRSLEVVR